MNRLTFTVNPDNVIAQYGARVIAVIEYDELVGCWVLVWKDGLSGISHHESATSARSYVRRYHRKNLGLVS